MRKIIFLICIALLASCKSKKAVINTTKPPAKAAEKTVVIVKPEEIESVKKDRAYSVGERLLESCNTSKFKAFGASEATEKVRQNATREKISAICKKINQRNGRFNGIDLVDISYNKKLKEHVFRYAINYEKKLYKRELFVTVNAENRVSAISTKEVTKKAL